MKLKHETWVNIIFLLAIAGAGAGIGLILDFMVYIGSNPTPAAFEPVFIPAISLVGLCFGLIELFRDGKS